MIFAVKLDMVLSGAKTQTRRLKRLHTPPVQVGRDYAVQPGWGKNAVARFKVLRVWEEDVRRIEPWDALAEGFTSGPDFLRAWASLYDKECARRWGTYTWSYAIVHARPEDLWTAWAIEFELCK